jgi:ankyrin repeat protein
MQVKQLISREVNILAHDHKGRTVLHYAAKKGHIDIVKLLAATGGLELLSKKSNVGKTPQEYAGEAIIYIYIYIYMYICIHAYNMHTCTHVCR